MKKSLFKVTSLCALSVTLSGCGLANLITTTGTELGEVNPGVLALTAISAPPLGAVKSPKGAQPTIKEALAAKMVLKGSSAMVEWPHTNQAGAINVTTLTGTTKYSHIAGASDFALQLHGNHLFSETDKDGLAGMYTTDKGGNKNLYMLYSKLYPTPYAYGDIIISSEKAKNHSRIKYGSYGVDTVNMHMPIVGEAKYKGIAVISIMPGNEQDDRDTYRSDINLDANFATGKVGGAITKIMSPTENVPGQIEIKTANIINNHQGVINTLGTGNGFSANLHSDKTLENYLGQAIYGDLKGHFYGAGASEVGGTISLKSTGPKNYRGVGAFIAKQ